MDNIKVETKKIRCECMGLNFSLRYLDQLKNFHEIHIMYNLQRNPLISCMVVS
jgi:hypothetical protein